MKNIILSSLLMANLVADAQTPSTKSSVSKHISTEEKLKLDADKIFDRIVNIRRDLHANPELGGHESNTQKIIRQYLLELGLEVRTDIYGYGIVGILKGAKKGKRIAWRAEMDALPNDFPDQVDFKSTIKGVQHGCGHDVHMAIALGIADVLAKNRKALQGTVYFIFQPQEEPFTGAKSMVDSGLFAKIEPSEVYGLHITPFPVGQIMVRANEMYAYQKGIRIQFKSGVNKNNLTALYQKIRGTLTRTTNDSKPWEIQHAIDPKDGLANPNTIFKDYFIIDENFISYFGSRCI
jgi:hypothetical protein